MNDRSYLVVSPCRDEAKYCRRTLDAMVKQTVRPTLWIIVDDGSKDQTPAILAEYAAKYDWIRIVTRADRGKRKLGGGVIDAFYAGYETVDASEFEYVCKLDLDLDLPPTYFERMISRMEWDRKLGTVSGKPYFTSPLTGKLIPEVCGDENSVGMAKFYRRECFEQIGGFVRELMWDGIDCHRCRMLGWKAASVDEEEVRFIHLRPMGTSDKSWWTGRVRHGYGQYFMGTSPAYMMASATYRLMKPPYLLGSVAMLRGYFGAMLSGVKRYGDGEFRQYLRRYQWNCLLKGKRLATAQLEARTRPVVMSRPAVLRPTTG